MQLELEKLFSNSLFLRVLMIVLLGPATLFALWEGGRLFAAVIAFVSIMLVFEWTRMVNRTEFSPAFYVMSFTAICAIFLAAGGSYFYAYLVCILGAAVSGFTEWVHRRPYLWPILGVVYLIIPCVAYVWLREGAEGGRYLIILLTVSVWMTDIGGYIWGKIIGGPKLVPSISPSKTWAGAIGGLLMAVIGAGALSYIFTGFTWPIWLLGAVGAIVSILSMAGDISESALKRNFKIKDSGGYIPGHGGLLDRLDGMLLATILVSIVLYFLGFNASSQSF